MDDYDPSEEFTISDVTEAESIITDNYNAVHPAGDLPSRALIEAGIFEDTGARLLMRDLQTLDGESPPPLDVVGRVVLLTEEGTQLESAPPGPLVRLTGVREWSVEYDELNVTIWVSTDVADYKLFTPAPLYANMWAVLQRKAALAARLLMLLADEPTMTYKTLVRLCVKCNSIPNAIQFKADEVLTYGTFLAEQIANGEGLDGCRALIGLREAIFKKEADEVAKGMLVQ